MKTLGTAILFAALSPVSVAGELTDAALAFADALSGRNQAKLRTVLWETAPTKDAFLKELATATARIEEAGVRISVTDKELIIGNQGVTLLRIEVPNQELDEFPPVMCVRVDGKWKMLPWTTSQQLKELTKLRTEEEQIHLHLFEEWAKMMAGLLNKKDSQQDEVGER